MTSKLFHKPRYHIASPYCVVPYMIKSLWTHFLRQTCEYIFNPLNTELNPICHLLALLGAHHILHVSRKSVKPSSYGKSGNSWNGCGFYITLFCLLEARKRNTEKKRIRRKWAADKTTTANIAVYLFVKNSNPSHKNDVPSLNVLYTSGFQVKLG